MTERPLLTFESWNGYQVALLGCHIVGAVRELPAGRAEWVFTLDDPSVRWRSARDGDAARAAILRYAADWYDAAHTTPAPGQGERLARGARVG